MALIDCPDCGNEVSDQADLCRHCGRPISGSVLLKANASESEFNFFDAGETTQLRQNLLENEKSKIHVIEKPLKQKKKKRKSYKAIMLKIRNFILMSGLVILVFYIKRKFF